MNMYVDVIDNFVDLFFNEKIMFFEWIEYLFFDICLVIFFFYFFEN